MMKSFFDKAKLQLHRAQAQFPSGQGQQQQVMKQYDSPSNIQPPTPLDVLRYRYHHGTNLGSIFVLEKWLHGSMYVNGAGESELDAVNAQVSPDDEEMPMSKSLLTKLDAVLCSNRGLMRLELNMRTIGMLQ